MAIRYTAKYLEPKLWELWHYDPETGKFTSKVRTWGRGRVIDVGDEMGTDSHGYVMLAHKGTNYAAHVVAWVWMKGELPPPGFEIDHKNKTKSDNRWRNLRVLKHGANMVNGSRRRDNTSEVAGVYRNRVGNWFARINVDNKIVHLGTYPTHAEAAEARRRAEVKFWRVPIEEASNA
jgi:hypothetical protein